MTDPSVSAGGGWRGIATAQKGPKVRVWPAGRSGQGFDRHILLASDVAGALGSGVVWETELVTVTTTWIEKSGPAVRAALQEWAPSEVAGFETDLRAALSRAVSTLDLGEVDAVLERWRGVAVIRANPLSSEEQSLVERVLSGDEAAIAALPPDPRG